MRLLTDLADACRRSGLVVIEDAGWRTRGHGPMNHPTGVLCHHTAGPAKGDAPSLRVVRDGRPGLPGPLSNLVLSRSGVVYVVAAGLSYHAGATFNTDQDNDSAIGIEAEATGVDEWPPVQYHAYVRLCRALCDHYGIPVDKVVGHKEAAKPLGRKIDPNFDMDAFRAAIRMEDDLTPEQAQMLTELHQRLARVETAWPGGNTDADNNPYDLLMFVKRLNVELHQLFLRSTDSVDIDRLADAVCEKIMQRMGCR